MVSEGLRRHVSLNNVILFFSAVLLTWLLYYFYTGAGGPQELAARLIPVAVILQTLSCTVRTISTNGFRHG